MAQSSDLTNAIFRQQCLVCNQEFAAEDDLKYCPVDGALLCPLVEDRLIDSIIDQKYEIAAVVGEGGYGKVYRARHMLMDKLVAVKVLTRNLLDSPESLNRFQAEARATVQLVHGSIVATLDHGIDPQPYIVMEYVEGQTLEDIIKADGPLTFERFHQIFSEVCQGMSVAHAAGCLHRDLKPSNIMIETETGKAKILDFGLVKVQGQDLTKTGEAIGSPPYMSPEQCMGQDVDERSDIYSLGCVMYESLAGMNPFEGATAVDCMYKHFHTIPEPISTLRKDAFFPSGLDYVLAKALGDISDRYKTMDQLGADLNQVAAGSFKSRLPKISRPTYRRTVKLLARISAIGNWTIIIMYILLAILSNIK